VSVSPASVPRVSSRPLCPLRARASAYSMAVPHLSSMTLESTLPPMPTLPTPTMPTPGGPTDEDPVRRTYRGGG
jgi:hypothetical protein